MSATATECRPDSGDGRESSSISAPVPDPEAGKVGQCESEPDSIVLILKYTDPDFVPTSPRYVPWSHTFGMKRATANDLAVALNRDVQHDRDRDQWHVVCKRKLGCFCVLRVIVPHGWTAESEYDLPPGAPAERMSDGQSRYTAVEFNRAAMREGVWTCRRWAVVVKPLFKAEGGRMKDEATCGADAASCEGSISGTHGSRTPVPTNSDHSLA